MSAPLLSDEQVELLCRGSESKMAAMREQVCSLQSALVAFSGGVDSTLVLKIAHEVLGDRAAALTALSASVPEREREEARQIARAIGVRHLLIDSRELQNPDYAKNPEDRCYFCKTELYDLCRRTAAELGMQGIVDGFNSDDRRDYRPGHRAAREHQIVSPLAEAGLGKQEVRAWSKRLGLSTWDKPQMACLASRLPYGTAVTAERLTQIGTAEQDLWELGFRGFRVRYHGETARLELAAEEFARLADPEIRERIARAIRARGFKFVAVDLEPFRSGRMNEAAGIRLAAGG